MGKWREDRHMKRTLKRKSKRRKWWDAHSTKHTPGINWYKIRIRGVRVSIGWFRTTQTVYVQAPSNYLAGEVLCNTYYAVSKDGRRKGSIVDVTRIKHSDMPQRRCKCFRWNG